MTTDTAYIIGAILTAIGVFYAARLNYRLGHEKNKNEEHQQDIDALKKRTTDAETQQAQMQAAAEDRAQQRKAEREQDRKDFETGLKQSRLDREADREAYAFQRTIVEQLSKDLSILRLENSEFIKQVYVLTKNNDILQREFAISEIDRNHKTAALETAQHELLRVTNALRDANHEVSDLRREMEVQGSSHDTEMKHINELTKMQTDNFQNQLVDHRQRIEQLQLSEGPRNMEITHLRYTLRAVHKKLNVGQIEEITNELLDRGLSYDGLLYPKIDPLLLPMVGADAEADKVVASSAGSEPIGVV